MTAPGTRARLQYGGELGWRALGVALTAVWYAMLTGAILNLIHDRDWAVVFVAPIWGAVGLLIWRTFGLCVIAEDDTVTVRNTLRTYRIERGAIERFAVEATMLPLGRSSVFRSHEGRIQGRERLLRAPPVEQAARARHQRAEPVAHRAK